MRFLRGNSMGYSWPQLALVVVAILLMTYTLMTFFNRGNTFYSWDKSENIHIPIALERTQAQEKLDFSAFKPNVQIYLKGTEAIRRTFLAKRGHFLMRGRVPGEIGMWEATDGATTVWNYFAPTFTCPHFVERVGTPGDGEKWVCGINVFEDVKKDCIVYSFGVAHESTFEMEILARTPCQVYAFDPTVSKMNLKGLASSAKSRVHFFKLGLGDSDNSSNSMRTLGNLMRQNGHEWIDFLKVDIEGSEFYAFQQIAKEFPETFPFGHLNLEVHLSNSPKVLDWYYGTGDKAEFRRFHDLFTRLENGGLRAFTWEDNHNPCLKGGKPTLMEYSFVNINNPRNQLLRF